MYVVWWIPVIKGTGSVSRQYRVSQRLICWKEAVWRKLIHCPEGRVDTFKLYQGKWELGSSRTVMLAICHICTDLSLVKMLHS